MDSSWGSSPPQWNFLWLSYNRILTGPRMPVPGIISPTLSEVLDYKLERSALFESVQEGGICNK